MMAWMDENVKFVPKDTNTQYVPQARPIENFWGSFAQKVYEGCWEAAFKTTMKEYYPNFVESLLEG
jgi:hypothetical protein